MSNSRVIAEQVAPEKMLLLKKCAATEKVLLRKVDMNRKSVESEKLFLWKYVYLHYQIF